MDNWKVLLTRIGLTMVTLLLVGCGPQETVPPYLAFVEVQKNGVGGVDGLRGVWSLAVSPDGKHVYTASYWGHAVAVFGRDETTGKLVFVEAHKEGVDGLDGIGGTCSVAVSPDGKHVYVAGHWVQAVSVFNVRHP
jgi:6-phosphogluconolactonase (cycloisomerase 2 family)